MARARRRFGILSNSIHRRQSYRQQFLRETLRKRLEEKKKAAVENSAKFRALAQMARNDSIWYGEDRPRWLGPISYDYPAYLTGELPGDYAFDILGLSKDPVVLQKYFNYELLHARWGMLAALGALIPELLNLTGLFQFVEPVWWRVGYSKLNVAIFMYLLLLDFPRLTGDAIISYY